MKTITSSDEIEFNDVYEGYVILEKETGMFLGKDSDHYRVALREQAARFTRKDAIKYINCGGFIKDDRHYTIQDAF